MTKHFWPHPRAALFMSRGVILGLISMMGLLVGCQMESDADLPPVTLAAPAVASPQYYVAPQPVPLYRPTPVATARVTPQRNSQPAASRFAPESGSGVPASWVPPVPANHWTWIIVHHSDSDYGSAAIIDKWHRDRGFDELGYHFVIGNGTNSGDGQIEVGPRWTKQKWGAHDNALDNRYNTNGIGICLVGDFNKTRPTPKQIHSLVRLIAYLMRKYDIPADRILGHGETKVTQCPGRYLNVASVREQAERLVAEGSGAVGGDQYADER